MRDYKHIEGYINRLLGDVYPQPEDEGHSALGLRVIDHWMSRMTTCHSVLDVGCGQGFCQPLFEKWDVKYQGVALGEDVIEAQDKGRNVTKMDFSFLDYADNSFDLIFSRHSLEHSPMPLLTLMEWYRVSRSWLGLVVPSPDWYGYTGRNHYNVLHFEQWKNLLDNAGWNVMWQEVDSLVFDVNKPDELKPHEYWIMCEKKR